MKWMFYIGKMDRNRTYFQQCIFIGPINLSHTCFGRQFTVFGYGFSFGSPGIYIHSRERVWHIYKTKSYKEYEAWKKSNESGIVNPD